MRMLYQLNKADEALAVFKMPELQGFFDQIVSFQLLMDLLYNNERYKEMLEVFDIIKNKQMENAKYPRNVVTLTLAACYKMVQFYILCKECIITPGILQYNII